jgi:hypothetical protein
LALLSDDNVCKQEKIFINNKNRDYFTDRLEHQLLSVRHVLEKQILDSCKTVCELLKLLLIENDLLAPSFDEFCLP